MSISKSDIQKHFFRDKDGRIVLWQAPNIPLYGWAVTKFASLFIANSDLKTGLAQLSTALLFVWAYLELTKGVNYFRKSLGLLVLAAIIISFFR